MLLDDYAPFRKAKAVVPTVEPAARRLPGRSCATCPLRAFGGTSGFLAGVPGPQARSAFLKKLGAGPKAGPRASGRLCAPS